MTVISHECNALFCRDATAYDLREQLAQTLAVFALHTMISQRTWSEPPIGSNMLAERPAFPTRAPRILTRDIASATGATDYW